MVLSVAKTWRGDRAASGARLSLAGRIWQHELGILRRYRTGRGRGLFEMANQKLKLPPHHLQPTDLLVHLGQPFPANCDDLSYLRRLPPQGARHCLQRTMEIKKLPDFSQGESDLVVATDEQDPV